MSDYDELPLVLDDLPEGSQADLWVTFHDDRHPSLVLKNVTAAVHYKGWWSIDYDLNPQMNAGALLQSDRVRMFSVVYRIPDAEVASVEATPDTADI